MVTSGLELSRISAFKFDRGSTNANVELQVTMYVNALKFIKQLAE